MLTIICYFAGSMPPFMFILKMTQRGWGYVWPIMYKKAMFLKLPKYSANSLSSFVILVLLCLFITLLNLTYYLSQKCKYHYNFLCQKMKKKCPLTGSRLGTISLPHQSRERTFQLCFCSEMDGRQKSRLAVYLHFTPRERKGVINKELGYKKHQQNMVMLKWSFFDMKYKSFEMNVYIITKKTKINDNQLPPVAQWCMSSNDKLFWKR